MRHIHSVIIGAGQAGLAMSRCLSDRSIRHVVIERGEVANSWRSERWDSLRLLTPNWQSRLPGFVYSGPNPDGFMNMDGITGHLKAYAEISRAPVETGTTVLSVTGVDRNYRVATDKGDWLCRNVVLASGACNRARIPGFAAALPEDILQITPLGYKNPAQLPKGGVLVVGASASGVQLAAEIAAAGHEVLLAAGQHVRVPRHYRGRDIQWWMDTTGVLDMTTREVDDIVRARRVPSLQLIGDHRIQFHDLNALGAAGVEVTGKLAGIRDGVALFSGALANNCALSDLKMNRLLAEFDKWAERQDEAGNLGVPERFGPTLVPASPRLSCDLTGGRIRTVVWATGFEPDFSWLRLPVFNGKGQLIHHEGRVAPGIYALGLPFMRRRKSALIDGVGADAGAHADHIMRTSGLRVA
ncbi:NAD(P)-binding domain-containing protein [Roseibium marinum]|uniref:Putative flavoprotein involved in K+ transport n=1 Tax=Roseibium marinum TaxID=281252 RepID=A0A2S3UXH9_9HYPH|nr:NAD(P)-binding domain-containing protein [Roseibium marinum]POF32417.1 putative flavoprotein involved in K+ transport [Roseibium marinum]